MSLQPVLDDEVFGERLTRARHRRKEGLREIAGRISEFWPVHYTTLSRLEGLVEAPRDRKRRALSVLYAFAIGFEPEAFGLSRGDLPGGVNVEEAEKRLAPRGEAKRLHGASRGAPDLRRGQPECVTAAEPARRALPVFLAAAPARKAA